MSDPRRARPSPDDASRPAAPSGPAATDGAADRLAEAIARASAMDGAAAGDDAGRGAPSDAHRAVPAPGPDLAELVSLAAALASLPALPAARRAAIDRALGLPDAAGAAGAAVTAPIPIGPASQPEDAEAAHRWPSAPGRHGGTALLIGILLLLTAAGLRAGRDRTQVPSPGLRIAATPVAGPATPDPAPIARIGTSVTTGRANSGNGTADAMGSLRDGRDGPAGASMTVRGMAAERTEPRPARAAPSPTATPSTPTEPAGPSVLPAPAILAAPPATDAPPATPRRRATHMEPATASPPASPTTAPDAGLCAGPAAPQTLTVHVVDGAGGALADADIAIGRAPDGPLDVYAVTGVDGCRRVVLAPGEHHVRASWRGLTRWYPSSADRSNAEPVAMKDTPQSLTVILATDDVEPAPAAMRSTPRRAAASGIGTSPDADGGNDTSPDADGGNDASPDADGGSDAAADAPASADGLPDRITQTGGAVTNVAFDAATGTVWAIVGPRLTAWRVAADGWVALGRSDVLPAVPEALAIGDGRVAIGLMGRGGPAEVWLFDAGAFTRPIVRIRIPLLKSGAVKIGAVAVGGQLVWAVTDRGVSILDLKPAAPVEVGIVATDDGRFQAMDALDWQGDVVVLGERRYAAVVRPWGLWLIDAIDPRRPSVRSSPAAHATRPRWPAFAVDARGPSVAFVDVTDDGPGRLTVLDASDPDRPVVRAHIDLADTTPAAERHSRPVPIRDDPRDGRSRGAAAAWRADGVTVLSADARWWAHAALHDDGPAWTASGTGAPWDASRAVVAVLDAAGTPTDHAPTDRASTDRASTSAMPIPPFVVAGGDAGLRAHFDNATSVVAPDIAPPLWQTVLGADADTLHGAAGRAGVATFAIGSDDVAYRAATRLFGDGEPGDAGSAGGGRDCGAVVAVAADTSARSGETGGGAVALTAACGLVTLAIEPDGRARVLGHVDWLAPQPEVVAHAVPLVVRDGRAAWVEAEADGRGAFVAVADVRSRAQPRRAGRVRPRQGFPVAIGAAPDAWLIMSSTGVGATLEVWPAGLDAAAPRNSTSLARTYRTVSADGGVILLSHPAEGPGTALLALEPFGGGLRAERSGWGFGAVALADSAFSRGDHVLASDGAALAALDIRHGLAPVGQSVALPHGQLIDAWGTSPQRDDVLWTRGDAYVALGDAGVLRMPGEALGTGPTNAPAPNRRPSPIYLPRLGAERPTTPLPAVEASDHHIVLFDGTTAAAAWLSANGGPDTLAVAVRAAAAANGPFGRLTLARWDDWAVRWPAPFGNDHAARAIARSVASAPGRERRADAALALAADVLGEAPPGAGHAILVAADDVAADAVAGAAARARGLADGGARLTVVLLGPPRPAPGLAAVADAGGAVVRSAVDAAALTTAMGAAAVTP